MTPRFPPDSVRRVTGRVIELFAHPGGLAARPMATVLNLVNGASGERAAGALGVRPGDRVLEVGFGGGAAVPSTLRALDGNGQLYAVDLSADMARLAARRFTADADDGSLVLLCADVSAIPFAGGTFDSAYALHSHMYWPSVLDGIREIRRVLAPGGRLLLGMDAVAGIRLLQWFGRGYRPAGPDELVNLFAEAGFVDISRRRLVGGFVTVMGRRP